MTERIETVRLTLRPITADDVDELVLLDSDPAVMRYINGGRPTHRSEMLNVVEAAFGHRWVAFDKSTDEFVGWFEIKPSAADEGDRELGYRLRRRAWGSGYATEGSLALIGYAFGDLQARRVWAQTMAVNTASRRVMERCGLRYVRTFHLEWPAPIEGVELGDVEYELLRDDWPAAVLGG